MTSGEMLTSCSNVLYDGELQLRGLTSEDVRSFLRDTQRLAVAVETYGNIRKLYSVGMLDMKSGSLRVLGTNSLFMC